MIRISAVIMIFIIAIFLFDGILQDDIAYLLYDLNRDFYYFAVYNKHAIIIFGFGFSVTCIILFTLNKTANYINILASNIDKIFEKDESLIELPEDFKEIETKMNTIKYNLLKNEKAAREAEQKKNDLVVYLAHDLKTPLTSVIGYLTLLTEEYEIHHELRQKYLSTSLEKAEHLERLINEFFEITRFNTQNLVLFKSRINVTHMLYQLVDEFYPMLTPKNLTCSLHVPNEVYIEGDVDQLVRVFDNLFRNAINYSYDNTKIEIQVTIQKEETNILFTNHGPTIPDEMLGRIFEKFYRLDASRTTKTGGSGLGLAIAKEIVELHEGSIEAVSKEERTSFKVTLPNLRKT